jgi:hypothetical protein
VSASDTTTHFLVLSVPGADVVVRLPLPGGASALLFVFLLPAAQGLHDFLTALHRAGRLNQQGTVVHSGVSGSAAGYFLHYPFKFLIKTLLVNVIYMIYMMFLSTLNKHTIDVTNIMIMLFF